MTTAENLNTDDTTPLWPDLLAFGIALACAWFLRRWSSQDVALQAR